MIFSLPKVDKGGVLAVHTTPQNRVGEYFCDNESNQLWVYLRANAALTRGMPLVSRPPQVITVGLQAAAAASRRLTFDSGSNALTVDGSQTSDDLNAIFPRVSRQPRNAEYMVVRETANDQMGTVHAHAARSMDVEWWSEDDYALTTALVDDGDVHLMTPWLVNHADGNAGSDGVVAFAQAAIAQGRYFWGLVEGIGIGLAAAAVTAGVGLLVNNNADGLSPLTEASHAVSHRVAYSLGAAADADEFPIVASAPARISIPPFAGGRSTKSYKYPAA